MEMTSLRKSVLIALGATALTFASPIDVVFAQPSTESSAEDEARERYKRGMQLFEEGNLEAAFIEFQRANELNPSFKIQYNIGLILKEQQDYAGAIKAFESYLTGGRDQIESSRRAAVEADIQTLRDRVGTIEVRSNVAGADVLVDDVPVGSTPLQNAVVNAGRHKVTVLKDGYVPMSRSIAVAGRDNAVVVLDLTSATSLPAAAPGSAEGASEDRPVASDGRESDSFPWVGWTLTGVFAAGAVVTGVLALGAEGDLADERDRPGASRASLDDKESAVFNYALTSDILTGAAIIAGGLSLYLTLDGDGPAASDASADVQVGVGPGNVLLRGSF